MFLLTGLASASNAILSRDFEALKYSPLRYQDKNTRFLLWLDFFFVLCRAFLFHFCVCPDVVSISEMTSGDLYSNISFELVSSNRWFTYAKNRLFEKHNAFVETLSLLYQFLPQELVIISVWTLMALGICKKKQKKKTTHSFTCVLVIDKARQLVHFGKLFYRYATYGEKTLPWWNPMDTHHLFGVQHWAMWAGRSMFFSLKLYYYESFSLNAEHITSPRWCGTTEELFPLVCHITETVGHRN